VFVLIGLLLVGTLYLVVSELNLQLMAAVLQGFFTVILIAIIVIFQEEIKHLFERLALWSLNRGLTRQQVIHLAGKEVEILIRTATDLARDRIGALIILRGQDPIVRHINGGYDLNGEMSEPLLKSLFDKHSIGHDGAVIVEGDRVLQFGCHLPLSKDLRKIPHGGGTRHAAGLGLSELSDVLCIIVSEERGTISIAQNGEIETIEDPEKLNIILQRFYDEQSPSAPTEGKSIVTHNVKEKSTAIVLTIVLWFFFVHEGRLTYKTFVVPVDYTNLQTALKVSDIKPDKVEITLSGKRRNFYFINDRRVRLVLNLEGDQEGFHIKPVQKSNLIVPENLELENISPQKVKIVLSSIAPGQ
jgi:uncharacterized protein (TIGR00159 family)